jgi:hypothetical protein
MMVCPVILAITFQVLKYDFIYLETTFKSKVSKSLATRRQELKILVSCLSSPVSLCAYRLPPFQMEGIWTRPLILLEVSLSLSFQSIWCSLPPKFIENYIPKRSLFLNGVTRSRNTPTLSWDSFFWFKP